MNFACKICLLAAFLSLLLPDSDAFLPHFKSGVSRLELSAVLKPSASDQQFPLGKIAFSLLPLTPESVGRRKTLLKELVAGKIWTLDQVQGIINVNVPVRCTVIKLKQGGLFVHNPVAPTKESVEMVKKLEAQHGPVKYVVLSSVALEHKGTIGPFVSKFPKAKVYIAPGQYSFPVNLPVQFFFPFGKKLEDLPEDSNAAPWGSEIQHKILGPLRAKSTGGFTDVAFFHVDTKTLLVTDVVVKVEDKIPQIIEEYPRALLFHARDSMLEIIKDTPANRAKGWKRMVLFGLTFQPAGIKVQDAFAAFKMLSQVTPEMRALGEGAIPFNGGLYPWTWVKSELPNFKALQEGLLVAPILQKLILNRNPNEVVSWVDEVCKWPFQRIIPCHLANDVKAGPPDFRAAFDFLYEEKTSNSPADKFITSFRPKPKGAKPLDEDFELLDNASKLLTSAGVVFPEAPKLVQ